MAACKGLVNLLKNDENSWPFVEPVDPVALDLPDYFECAVSFFSSLLFLSHYYYFLPLFHSLLQNHQAPYGSFYCNEEAPDA